MTTTFHEPARDIPVIAEADVCVLGGSCTGVFAAVRSARLGARVVTVEAQGRFGGVAVNSLVNVWHSLFDTEGRRQIIAGLTQETTERLRKRGAVVHVEDNPSKAFVFNSEELAIELDELIVEAGIRPHLHTRFCAPLLRNGRLVAVAVENKSGRGAIRARVFIDATGDGDLCERLGLETYRADVLQPPTTCARFTGWPADCKPLLRRYGRDYNLPEGFIWSAGVPGSEVRMVAGTRILHRDCSIADDLTAAEMEGRRQIRAMMDIVRRHRPESGIALQALPSGIGIRQTRQVRCLHQLSDDEVLYGVRFSDAIANGSYRVDVHHQDRPGITLKYLDGTQVYTSHEDDTRETSRWREQTEENPTFYQIPFRSIVPAGAENVLIAGRMLDAQAQAFGAVRVMVNTNQTGEAAGIGAYLALSREKRVGDIDPLEVRTLLQQGGSVVI